MVSWTGWLTAVPSAWMPPKSGRASTYEVWPVSRYWNSGTAPGGKGAEKVAPILTLLVAVALYAFAGLGAGVVAVAVTVDDPGVTVTVMTSTMVGMVMSTVWGPVSPPL